MANNGFIFVSDVESYHGEGYEARLPRGLTTERALCRALAAALKFPSYFGENWNALLDLLRDLSWIDEHVVTIIHGEIPRIGDSAARVYLEVLRDAVEDWKPGEEHELRAVFPAGEKPAVHKLLGLD